MPTPNPADACPSLHVLCHLATPPNADEMDT